MMIYCRACGLYMTNGFCLHGDGPGAVERRLLVADLERQFAEAASPRPHRSDAPVARGADVNRSASETIQR